jgi:hypothetical protein
MVDEIERILGVAPHGIYSDVRVRLDILEARINNPLVPSPNVEDPFIIGDYGVTISSGDGYPTEDRVNGSLYLRRDGYSYSPGVYSRRDGYWVAVDSSPSGSGYPSVFDLVKGSATDSTGIATSIGACYLDNTLWAPTRTVLFRCILESSSVSATYAAVVDLYDTSGSLGVPAQIIGSQIDNTIAANPQVASMIEIDITSAFAVPVVGVVEARLWIATSGGGNVVTCKSAQIIIEG